MPWLFLWISAYILGWFYFLNHFFILDYLDNTVLISTNFPLVSIIFVSLIVAYMVGSLQVLEIHFSKRFVFTRIVITLIYISALINHFRIQPYVELYWQNSIVVYVIILIASISLYGTTWKYRQYPKDNLELAHMIWYGIYATFFGIANLLIAINGARGLLGFIIIPENSLQYVAYTCNLIGMVAINIMVLPDDILFHTLYPIRIWQYQRLRTLGMKIHHDIKHKKNIFPISDSENDLDTQIHQTLISILDDYPYLDKDHDLRNQLWQIEQSSADFEELLWQILRIKQVDTT